MIDLSEYENIMLIEDFANPTNLNGLTRRYQDSVREIEKSDLILVETEETKIYRIVKDRYGISSGTVTFDDESLAKLLLGR